MATQWRGPRERERQTDRHTERGRDRETERQTQRQTERQTDRQKGGGQLHVVGRSSALYVSVTAMAVASH